ncbi:hypothetical protein [Ornithinibacillus bavariensis]|uniref:YhfM-like domain-containing protein n=1 Tax=Ornithinibacillus bavariensis TaxID=545502 RepID=A0A919X606_9BACI|nr:hypothetical protein [Ornithinibacillus bavariensis]GIO26556.1 hypothetical protein J43TS3_11670 [Ornithinibacillus bavariensis]
MRKMIWFTLLLLFMASTLVGCQLTNSTERLPDGNSDSKKSSNTELRTVSISSSRGFANINPDYFIEYDDTSTLSFFEKLTTSAEKVPGIVNMAEPEFDLLITDVDGSTEGYHLWIGAEGGKSTLMNITDTHTIYSISEDLTSSLREFVQSK